MARYRTTIQSKKSPEEAFDYLADFANAREWDPGVVEGENLTGQPLGQGSRFRLVSRFAGRRVPLEYQITAFDRPRRVVFQADQAAVRSTDEIRFDAVDDGTSVTYEADLRLEGPAGQADGPVPRSGLPAHRRPGRRRAAQGAQPMSVLSDGVDAVLEATVVGSFSRIGYDLRSRLEHWPPPGSPHCLAGRTVLVTGATSGIGLFVAVRLAQLGASVRFLARDEARAEQARDRIQEGRRRRRRRLLRPRRRVGLRRAAPVRHALRRGQPATGRAGAQRRGAQRRLPPGCRRDRAHRGRPGVRPVPAHRAVAATAASRRAGAGDHGVVRGHVHAALRPRPRSRWTGSDYDGTVAYARAKRAQVVLNREWARRVPADEVVFHAMHPGWVDTPGVESSLPTFHRLMRPCCARPTRAPTPSCGWRLTPRRSLPAAASGTTGGAGASIACPGRVATTTAAGFGSCARRAPVGSYGDRATREGSAVRLGLRDLQRAKLKFGLLGGALALLVFLLLFLNTLSTTLLGFFTGAVKHNSAQVLVYNAERAPQPAGEPASAGNGRTGPGRAGRRRGRADRQHHLTADVGKGLTDLSLFGWQPGLPGGPARVSGGVVPEGRRGPRGQGRRT